MTGVVRGLFVGVDKYHDPRFQRLRYASRDARVLHALVSDNFPGDLVLLQDEEVTLLALTDQLDRLKRVSTDEDVVLVTFSGHGTRSRELATHDADPLAFAETALPLRRFVDLVKGIRARLLVVVLDCCFSGSMMSRAFFEPDDDVTARADQDVWNALQSLNGEGRVFLGASASDEQSFESGQYGHGVLTHHLLQGLMGGHAVLDAEGRVSLARLVSQVLDKVSAEESGTRRRRQRPTFEGQLSQTTFPVLVPGPRYAEVGDHQQPPPVNKDLMSLVAHGIPEPVAEVWRQRVGKLNDMQVEAINRGGLLRGGDVLVSAPTASGKTLVGEIAAVRAVAGGGKAVFLLPSRALVNEQYEQLRNTYEPLGPRVVRATGGLRDQIGDLLAGAYEIAVLTYETFISLVAANPNLVERVKVLVVDEIQTMVLPDRGPRLELLLTRLRRNANRGRSTPQLVGLSAVLGNPETLASWLAAELVQFGKRAIELSEGVLGLDGTYRYRSHGGDRPEVADAVRHLIPACENVEDAASHAVAEAVARGDRVLVFRATRNAARMFARKLARRLGLPPAKSVLDSVPQDDLSRVGEVLRECLAGGVAFHNTDLREAEQQAVVQSFRDTAGEVKVVVATTTLAQGVNLSAHTVVMWELEHPGNPARAYTTSEYKNMAGRAGRLTPGRAVVLCAGGVEAQRIWRDYVTIGPEPVSSALLAPDIDLDSLVLTVLKDLSGTSSDANSVADYLAWTFGAFQDRTHTLFPVDSVQAAMTSLRECGLVADAGSGLQVTPLGETVVRSGLRVASARVLVDALTGLEDTELTRMTLIGIAHLVAEVDDARFARASANWQAEYDSFSQQLIRQRCAREVVRELLGPRSKGGARIDRGRRALACKMWSTGQPMAAIEQALTLHMRPSDGVREPGPVAHAAQRTADIIGAVVDIAFHIHPDADLGELAQVLHWQLSLGIATGLVPIARHLEQPVDREVYLRLAKAGLPDAASVASADAAVLLSCAGEAESVAEAVRVAAKAAVAEAEQPDLDDLIPLPED
ncbi:DEAD/DEAH box helicase [Actinokineospora globicatena]|uniref:DEAD/DEAH box helicase n=1 Tax=Actinokineospora globicatena TaxID=103729 RepID=UPI0025556F69|nr:DEAD/DEAH box helicase [Actinokineospora globicatena]